LVLETLSHSKRFSGIHRGLCKTEYMNAMGYVGAIISIIAGCLGLIWPKQVIAGFQIDVCQLGHIGGGHILARTIRHGIFLCL